MTLRVHPKPPLAQLRRKSGKSALPTSNGPKCCTTDPMTASGKLRRCDTWLDQCPDWAENDAFLRHWCGGSILACCRARQRRDSHIFPIAFAAKRAALCASSPFYLKQPFNPTAEQRRDRDNVQPSRGNCPIYSRLERLRFEALFEVFEKELRASLGGYLCACW